MRTKLQLAALALLLSLVAHPPAASAVPPVTGVACGYAHTLFVKSDGSLWAMGYNGFGQLGLGNLVQSTNRPQLVVANGVSAVAAGMTHSLLRVGNSLWVMGDNEYGELGDGTTTDHLAPEKVFSGSASLSVSALGTGPAAGHSLFATSGFVAGSTGLRAMGNNFDGELGDGTYTNHLSPETIVLSSIPSIGCGLSHSLFIKSDGSLWGMGDNSFGQLGITDGIFLIPGTNRPTQIVTSNVSAVACGVAHSLFFKSDSSLWAMGNNDSGQLGDNTVSTRFLPKQVATNVIAIAAGGMHSLFIKSDGSLWGMGDNLVGQLGQGPVPSYRVPVQIVPSNVVAVAAGGSNTCFIKLDGSLWGMGDNSFGQLGDGTYTNHLVPFQIVAGIPPAPFITSFALSRTNLNLTGVNGVAGETLVTLMSTNLALPLSQWQAVATNVLSANGNFSFTATNAAVPDAPQRFYILKAR